MDVHRANAEDMRAASQYHTITLPASRFYPTNGTFSTEFGVLCKDVLGEETVSMNPIIILIYDYSKYIQLPGYAHYKSAKFNDNLKISFDYLDAHLAKRTRRRLRLFDPPNSTMDEPLDTYSNDDFTPLGWSSDEDRYLAEQEDFWS